MPNVSLQVADIMSLPDGWANDCDLTFTDPPWEQGLVKMFETIRYKQTAVERVGNTIDGILNKLFQLAPKGKPCFVEYGMKGYERVEAIGQENGFVLAGTVIGTQLSGQPYATMCFNTDMNLSGAANLQGWGFLDKTLAHHKPTKVFEPFAGHGQHARRIAANGYGVRATEFNAARAEKCRIALKL